MSDKQEKKPVEDKPSEQATSSQTTAEPPEDGETETASGVSLERLRKYLAEKLGFYDEDDEDDKTEHVKILDENSLDGIVSYIKKHNCKNIITMAGAGISTSAGIPDFRSPGTGLYHNLKKYKLPHPQAIFEIDFFRKNPKPFFVLAKELYPGSFKPTICHYFIKLLNEKGYLLRHYTQNIDTLERVAGIPEDKLVEAHGTFHTSHCLDCRQKYSLPWMKERIFKDEIPTCEKCSGVVKPDIIFFGEGLPNKFHDSLHVDFPKCDLLIILGSSLAVQPFASLIDKVPKLVPRLLINREKAGHKTGIMAVMNIGGGMDFDGKHNTKDVAWLGDCDDGCLLLAEKLGFGDELKKLCKEEHEKFSRKTEEPQKEDPPKSPKI